MSCKTFWQCYCQLPATAPVAFILKRHPGSPAHPRCLHVVTELNLRQLSLNPDLGNGRSFSGCGSAPRRPLLGLRLPGLRLPPADPTAWPGCPGRPLRRPPVRLGLNGHHLHAQAGGGTAVCQRLLCERRGAGHQFRGALHVPDPHGDLSAGPAGEKPEFYFLTSCVRFKLYNREPECDDFFLFIYFWKLYRFLVKTAVADVSLKCYSVVGNAQYINKRHKVELIVASD